MTLRLLKMLLRGLLNTFVVLLWIGTVWIVLEHYLSRESCVVLPNGYMIGYPNIFGPEDEGLVEMILRDPSGEVLVRADDVYLERVPGKPDQVKVIYRGGAMEMDGTKMMPLIWDDHSSRWHDGRKWNEPDPDDPGSVGILSTSFWSIYLWLRRSNEFETVSCGTPWFDWGDSTRRYCAPGDCQ